MGTRCDRMTEEEFVDKKTQMNNLMVGMQLDAVVKLLNGKLQHFTCVDSSGKKYKKWVIDYDHKDVK
jgi:hypothetical protein